jgi:hypothetical protein
MVRSCMHMRQSAQRRAGYELVGWSVSHAYQLRQVKAHKTSNPCAAGVHSHVLQLVCTDLELTPTC